jgi:hypothetical protein
MILNTTNHNKENFVLFPFMLLAKLSAFRATVPRSENLARCAPIDVSFVQWGLEESHPMCGAAPSGGCTCSFRTDDQV